MQANFFLLNFRGARKNLAAFHCALKKVHAAYRIFETNDHAESEVSRFAERNYGPCHEQSPSIERI